MTFYLLNQMHIVGYYGSVYNVPFPCQMGLFEYYHNLNIFVVPILFTSSIQLSRTGVGVYRSQTDKRWTGTDTTARS